MEAKYTQKEMVAFAQFFGVEATEAHLAKWEATTKEGGTARIRRKVLQALSDEGAAENFKNTLLEKGIFLT